MNKFPNDVPHLIYISIVGADRFPLGYHRVKALRPNREPRPESQVGDAPSALAIALEEQRK